MNVVAPRNGLNCAKPRTLDASRKDEMSIDPRFPGRQLREGHADLECNPRLFRKNADGPVPAHGGNKGIENPANVVRLTSEVLVQCIPSAGMALISVREFPRALRTFPERPRLCHSEWI